MSHRAACPRGLHTPSGPSSTRRIWGLASKSPDAARNSSSDTLAARLQATHIHHTSRSEEDVRGEVQGAADVRIGSDVPRPCRLSPRPTRHRTRRAHACENAHRVAKSLTTPDRAPTIHSSPSRIPRPVTLATSLPAISSSSRSHPHLPTLLTPLACVTPFRRGPFSAPPAGSAIVRHPPSGGVQKRDPEKQVSFT